MSDDQFVEVTYGEVRLVAPDREPPAKPKLRDAIAEWLQFFRSVLLSGAVVLSIVAILYFTILGLIRRPVVIDAISVPEALQKQGFTESVVAHRLWAAILEIQEQSGTSKQHESLLAAPDQLDVVEPGSGLSLQNLTRMLRELLGIDEKRISGEFTCGEPTCDWTNLTLILRVRHDDGTASVRVDAVEGARELDYFHHAALKILRELDPYTVASYLYDRDGMREEAIAIAEELVSGRHSHQAWGAHMLGLHENDAGAYTEAAEWFQRSIDLAELDGPENFTLPWFGLGNSLGSLGRYAEAIEKYRRVTEIDPDFAAVGTTGAST